MKNLILTFGLSALLAGSAFAAPKIPQRVGFQDYVTNVTNRSLQMAPQWRSAAPLLNAPGMRNVVTDPGDSFGPVSYWGSVNTPDGEEWMYSAVFDEEDLGNWMTTIHSAAFTIYDSNFNEYRKFTAEFELQEGETSINFVQLAPTLSRKFFNINEDYEVMVFVHATTEDYTGHLYTQVYTLSDGSLVTTIEGDNIGSINTSEYSWSEEFTMVFMREETIIDGDNYQYTLYFDVYSRASWGGECKLEHTFTVDYSLVAGAGNYALPILFNKHGNKIYYALARYEKPYFESSWSEDINPDNHFIIDLYDNKFELVKTTTIPMEIEDGALFSFPGLGELYGNRDMVFDTYDFSEYPHYIIGIENYITSTDDFSTSLYVYDSDGNRILNLVKNVDDYIRMSDLQGFEDQFCCYNSDDNGGYFTFINMPSGEVSAQIPLALGDASISTSIDRTRVGAGYGYISSILSADVDNAGNAIHHFAWFDQSGKFERYDNINLGGNIALAQAYIANEALSPYVFNTDSNREYMFLVKEYLNEGSSMTREYLRIYNENSEKILEIAPDDATESYINTVFLINTTKTNPQLIIAFTTPDGYRVNHLSLPLTKFDNGSGTVNDPYVITSPGELMIMYENPSAYYTLGADINFNNTVWKGNQCDFTGVLDGKGYTISNLNLIGSGMFENILYGAEIKNINFSNVTMVAEGTSGILAGSINGGDQAAPIISDINIDNAFVSGSDEALFGGIAGWMSVNSIIQNCSITNASYVFSNDCTVGGILGEISSFSSITNSLFVGDIAAGVAGGIVGCSFNGKETITNCHSDVVINAFNIAGGILGESARTKINNCYADGSIIAVGTDKAYAGGITGWIKTSYESSADMIVENCIVAAKVSANTLAQECIAHRIVGYTSGDEWLVDWESTDPSVDWNDPSTYPYIPGEKEHNLRNNYAIHVEAIDASVAENDDTTEGKTITSDELTSSFLAEHAWTIGEIWKHAGSGLALVSEDFTLSVYPNELTNVSGDETVEFSCPRRYAQFIKIESSDPNVAIINKAEVSADNKSVICEISLVGSGACSIIASLGEDKAECSISTQTSIIDILDNTSDMTYDGYYVMQDNVSIRIYSISGILVAEGYEKIDVTNLVNGTYIAVSDTATLKFIR